MNQIAFPQLCAVVSAVLIAGGWLADNDDHDPNVPGIPLDEIEPLIDETLDAVTTLLEEDGDLSQLLDALLAEDDGSDVNGIEFKGLYNSEFTLEGTDDEGIDLELLGDGTNSLLGATALRFGVL